MSQKDLILLLREQLIQLGSALKALEYSWEKCKTLELGSEYTLEELEVFEAFTSRFSRISDLLVQKLFRTIDEVELETGGSVRDRLNRAEKRELIQSVDQFRDIIKLRNKIAHEYLAEGLIELFEDTMSYAPVLQKTVHSIEKYAAGFDF